MRLLTYVVATSSADSSTNTTPPEFANPTGPSLAAVPYMWKSDRMLAVPASLAWPMNVVRPSICSVDFKSE